MARSGKHFGEVVGVTESGEVYILDYTFDSGAGDGFKGAVGTHMRPVTRAEYEEATEQEALEERFEDVWQMMAGDGRTTESLADFAARAFAVDGDEAVFDLSNYEYWEDAEYYVRMLNDRAGNPLYELDEEIVLFDCNGGGRCFSSFDEMQDMFVLMPNTELWLDINRAEREED